jgi:hypothetical protein
MIQLHSFRQRLTDELQKVEVAILELWRKSGIDEFRNDPNSGVLFIVHPY